MLALQAPGLRTARLYVWLVLLAPVFLFTAGAALLVIGLWQESGAVAGIGAGAVVGGLVLPRLHGAFEFGPGGVKGSQMDGFLSQLIAEGSRQGLPAEDTLDLATEASESQRALTTELAWPEAAVSQGLAETRRRVVSQIARNFAAEAMALERRATEILRRVAERRGWELQEEVRVRMPVAEGVEAQRTVDFVIATLEGPVVVEAAVLRVPTTVARRSAWINEARQALNARLALIVVPEGDVVGQPTPNVEIVAIDQLEARLEQL